MAIPGVKTIIKDRFYSISRQDLPVGPRVAVIAKRSTANGIGNVPDLDAVQVSNEADVITAFGQNSDLHRAYVELVSAGAERVFVIPLPSDTVFVRGTSSVQADITSGGSSIWDAAFMAAESILPDVIVPWGRGGHPFDWDLDGATPNTATTNEDFGFYANDTTTIANSTVYRIAQSCSDISLNSHPTFAVLGVKPYVSSSEVMTAGNVATHLTLSSLANRELDIDTDISGGYQRLAEIGRHVFVIAAELIPSGYDTSWGYTNGAASLAGALSRMASYTSPSNKVLYNIQTMRYNPTRTVQAALGGKGVNTVALNFNRVPIFAEGLTFASGTSDYTRISTMRIISEASLLIRQVCQKFVGEASTIQVRNSMETAITSALRGMMQLGALLDADFAVSYVPNENKAIIDLVVTPAFELKTIEVRLSVNLA
jgi:hypothetical protein